MYTVTLEIDVNTEYKLQGTLPAECVEAFCRGVMRDGIELADDENHTWFGRTFVRPQAVYLKGHNKL